MGWLPGFLVILLGKDYVLSFFLFGWTFLAWENGIESMEIAELGDFHEPWIS